MEASNVKAMRKTLSDAYYAMFNFLETQNGGYEEMANALDNAKAALAAPAMNCDVGTVEEQSERYLALCNSNECTSCPHKCGECEEPFDTRSFRDVLGARIKELLDGGMAGTRKRVDMMCE